VAVKLGTDDKNCDWIYRISANPGDTEGQRPAAHSGLGTWVGARVASPRCLILRPGCWNVPRATTALQSGRALGAWSEPQSVPESRKSNRKARSLRGSVREARGTLMIVHRNNITMY
jgi:hypothetical protein